MFGSQGQGGFGAPAAGPSNTMASNPFGHQPAGVPAASNPFQTSHASVPAPAAPTMFGSRPVAPAFGQTSGFGAAQTASNPFASTNNSSSGVATATTFGGSSGAGFGKPTPTSNAFSTTTFGTNSSGFRTSATGPTPPPPLPTDTRNGFGFGSNASAKASSNATTFGQPGVRLKKKVQRDGAPLLPATATAFGVPTSNIRVRRKGDAQLDGDSSASSTDNPFAPAANVQTAFGQPPRRVSPSPASIRSSTGSNPFGPSASPPASGLGALGALEARLNGTKKQSPKPKRSANNALNGSTSSSTSIDPTGMQPSKKFGPRSAAKASAAFTGSSDTDTGPFNAPMTRKKAAARSATTESAVSSLPAPTSNTLNNDETSKAQLASAVNLDGTCVDMCSAAERELHIRVDELSAFEKCFPDAPGLERELIIKRFQRSSADHKLDIPSEIRPPGVLRRTQLYIEQAIMDRDRAGVDARLTPPRVPDPIELYNFCWDRFRMLRKDFVLQNYRGAGGRIHPIVLDVHERIARYHILSEHELVECPSFVAQQNMEQLGQTLKSLNELYDESSKTGDVRLASPFEPEFRAYFILCALDNGRGLDVLKFVKGLPRAVAASTHVTFAMDVFVARHTHDYHRFCKLLRHATYLQACLLFRYLPSVRSGALQRMNRAFRNQPYPLADVMSQLCFDDLEHAADVCARHGLALLQVDPTDATSIVIQFGDDFETDIQLRRNKRPLPVRGSRVYVGQKQGAYLRKDICRGVTEYDPHAYPRLSQLIDDLERHERATMYPTQAPYDDAYSVFADYTQEQPMPQPPRTSHQQLHHQQQQSARHGATAAASSGLAPGRAYNTGPTPPPPLPPAPAAVSGYGFDDDDDDATSLPMNDNRARELEAIARRKAELERTHQLALQRIQELEHAKARAAVAASSIAPTPSATPAPTMPTVSSDAAGATAAAARERADKDDALLAMQRELEAKLRAQEQQRRAQQAVEQAAAAAAAAQQREREQEAERQREALAAEQRKREQQQLEAEQRAAAEQQRRRDAEIRERERQQRAAEEQQRQRDAALALEQQRALAKQRRRAKQQRAVLQLRFRIWTKYVRAAKALPPPTLLDASRFGVPTPLPPKRAIEWLFKDAKAAAAVGTRLRHPSEVIAPRRDVVSTTPLSSWHALDVLALVAPALQAHSSAPTTTTTIQWKLVVGDLADSQRSSFGVWCAAKLGLARSQTARTPMRVFHSTAAVSTTNEPAVAICCRLFDAAAIDDAGDSLSADLRGVAALLLPLSLSEIVDAAKRTRWMARVEALVAASASARTARSSGIVALLLLYANVAPSLATRDAVTAIESFMQALQRRTATNVLERVDYALVPGCSTLDADANTVTTDTVDKPPVMVRELAHAVTTLARATRALQPLVVSVTAKELVDAAVGRAMQQCAATATATATELQSAIGTALTDLVDSLAIERHAVETATAAATESAVPELDDIVGSRNGIAVNRIASQYDALADVLAALAAVKIELPLSPALRLARNAVCDRYFAAIATFVDRVFATSSSTSSPAAPVATHELKTLVYNLLVPVHARLVVADNNDSDSLSAADAAAALPWRQIVTEVYSAFSETLDDDDLSVVVTATWRAQTLQRSSASLVQINDTTAATTGFAPTRRRNAAQALPVVPAVSMRSLKRSFGDAIAASLSPTAASTLSTQQQRVTTAATASIRDDPRVVQLRQAIAHERAASARFQQLLQREVRRWDAVDDLEAR